MAGAARKERLGAEEQARSYSIPLPDRSKAPGQEISPSSKAAEVETAARDSAEELAALQRRKEFFSGSSSDGHEVKVIRSVSGGAGGSAGGISDGGRGRDVSIVDSVNGSTTGNLYLTQGAGGGAGGGAANGNVGTAGNAISSLTVSGHSALLSVTATASGGAGGDRSAASGVAGSAGGVTSISNSSNDMDSASSSTGAFGGTGGTGSQGAPVEAAESLMLLQTRPAPGMDTPFLYRGKHAAAMEAGSSHRGQVETAAMRRANPLGLQLVTVPSRRSGRQHCAGLIACAL